MTFWVIQTFILAIWLSVVSFIWNNKWRGSADHAALYRDPVFTLVIHLVWIAFPAASSFMMLFRYGLLLALITLILYAVFTFAISEWRYLVVFREYRKLHEWDLRQKGQLSDWTDAEIDGFVDEWLKMNVKKR